MSDHRVRGGAQSRARGVCPARPPCPSRRREQRMPRLSLRPTPRVRRRCPMNPARGLPLPPGSARSATARLHSRRPRRNGPRGGAVRTTLRAEAAARSRTPSQPPAEPLPRPTEGSASGPRGIAGRVPPLRPRHPHSRRMVARCVWCASEKGSPLGRRQEARHRRVPDEDEVDRTSTSATATRCSARSSAFATSPNKKDILADKKKDGAGSTRSTSRTTSIL